jgi:hypothetical protein
MDLVRSYVLVSFTSTLCAAPGIDHDCFIPGFFSDTTRKSKFAFNITRPEADASEEIVHDDDKTSSGIRLMTDAAMVSCNPRTLPSISVYFYFSSNIHQHATQINCRSVVLSKCEWLWR